MGAFKLWCKIVDSNQVIIALYGMDVRTDRGVRYRYMVAVYFNVCDLLWVWKIQQKFSI